MLLSRSKKNNVYPCKPHFYNIKVGFKGLKLYRRFFCDVGISRVHESLLIFSATSKDQINLRGPISSYSSYAQSTYLSCKRTKSDQIRLRTRSLIWPLPPVYAMWHQGQTSFSKKADTGCVLICTLLLSRSLIKYFIGYERLYSYCTWSRHKKSYPHWYWHH